MGDIVAFTQMAGADKDPVRSLGEGPKDKGRIDPSGTHHPDQPDFSGIL
jgi:hypothetical protein